MSDLDKYQQSNADNDISLAWDEFQKCGEIANNAESVLFAAEYYQTQCKTITKQRDELSDALANMVRVVENRPDSHYLEVFERSELEDAQNLLSTIKEQKDDVSSQTQTIKR